MGHSTICKSLRVSFESLNSDCIKKLEKNCCFLGELISKKLSDPQSHVDGSVWIIFLAGSPQCRETIGLCAPIINVG